MIEALEYSFFQRALLAAFLASTIAGVSGTFVVVKRISTLSGGLAHAVFGGVGLALFLGYDPTLGAIIFGILCSALIAYTYLTHGEALDTLVAITWALGMALGILFISRVPGAFADLHSYLFGSILLVPDSYIALLALLNLFVILMVVLFYYQLQAITFDEEFSLVSGLRVQFLMIMLFSLITLAIVSLLKVVGIVLTIALLTIPAASARIWVNNLWSLMLIAVGFCLAAALFGVFGSYYLSSALDLSLPTGPLIIVFSIVLYIASLLLMKARR